MVFHPDFLPVFLSNRLNAIRDSLGKPPAQQQPFLKHQQKLIEYLQCFTLYPIKTIAEARQFLERPDVYVGQHLSTTMRNALSEMLQPVMPLPATPPYEFIVACIRGAVKLRLQAVLKTYNLLCEVENHPELKLPMPQSDGNRRKLSRHVLQILYPLDCVQELKDSLVYLVPVNDSELEPPPESPIATAAPASRPACPARRPGQTRANARNAARELADRWSQLVQQSRGAAQPAVPDDGALQILEGPAVLINPNCMLCGQLLTEPVRFYQCKHNTYFDLECYKQINRANCKMTCPYAGCASRYDRSNLASVSLDMPAILAAYQAREQEQTRRNYNGPMPEIHEID